MDHQIININMAEMAASGGNTHILTTSLGSCVAIVLHDANAQVGGMAHAMLPSRDDKPADVIEVARRSISTSESVAKYADESVDRLIAEIEKLGGKKENLTAKLIGGAKMFRILSGDNFGVGYRNAEAAKARLKALGIPITAEDTGGIVGRAADFNIGNGLVEIVTVI